MNTDAIVTLIVLIPLAVVLIAVNVYFKDRKDN